MEEIISLSYGNGGKKTYKLINELLIPNIGNDILNSLGDGASLRMNSSDICFSTDSFVIDPYIFPGGDIGKLSVCGTINDLVMCGSIPKFLSLSFILEEGFLLSHLELVIKSIADTVNKLGVLVVTGDTKVVDRGHGHGIYINTSGIGEKIPSLNLSEKRIAKGDKVILTGACGNHGIAILCAREELLESNITSDCMPLIDILNVVQKYGESVKIMRDPTRGGIATTLNEFVENIEYSIELQEELIPIDDNVKNACDLLGLDPLYSANEGKALIVVSEEKAEAFLKDLREIHSFKDASIIGQVVDYTKSKVILQNPLGGKRILDKLSYDLLPRIC
ncbi:hydrogenase expression/formation protein HypE [Desnuesiella massiliensis]|uniref:hydrogenase expression/formation protein HypE n=1 Tax=Desnuesiella massiliensis TaxID=1650662 RepID=UPI0006E46E9D|nr:hydrogenase expression/formation protein HypE [Desnuesiella massiliensis]